MASFQGVSIQEMQQVEGGFDWGTFLESLLTTVFLA